MSIFNKKLRPPQPAAVFTYPQESLKIMSKIGKKGPKIKPFFAFFTYKFHPPRKNTGPRMSNVLFSYHISSQTRKLGPKNYFILLELFQIQLNSKSRGHSYGAPVVIQRVLPVFFKILNLEPLKPIFTDSQILHNAYQNDRHFLGNKSVQYEQFLTFQTQMVVTRAKIRKYVTKISGIPMAHHNYVHNVHSPQTRNNPKNSACLYSNESTFRWLYHGKILAFYHCLCLQCGILKKRLFFKQTVYNV